MAFQHSIWRLGQRLAHSTQARLASRPFDRRRRFFLLMGASAVVASACASTAQTDDTSAAAPAAVTKRIQHALGETDVPVNPARIVALGYFEIEALMSLGLQPIAAPSVVVDNLLHLPSASAIADTGLPKDPNLEKIATLKPDLILTNQLFTDAASYPRLSQIAPTVVFDVNGHAEWQKLTRLCAETLGKDAEVARLEADYEAKLEAFRSQLSEEASQIQVSVASFYAERISLFGRDTFTGTVLAAAGVSRPPKQLEDRTQISIELLSEIDGDILFVMKPQSQTEVADDARAALEQMKANPLWNQLNVVQTNRVYEVDTYWFGVGYIAANLVLDDLIKYIAKDL